MSLPLTNIEKTRRLKFALAGDAANAIYINLATAGSVLLLFMQKISLDKTQMGILLAALGFGPMIAPVTSQIGARLGFKRLALTFTLLRVLPLAGMIFAPTIAKNYGPDTAFTYVALVLAAFSLFRSTADSMGGPWSTEYVPAAMRGRYTARQMIVTMLCGAAAIFSIGLFLGADAPIARFQEFFSLAILFGLLPAVFYAYVPGGAPRPDFPIAFTGMLAPLRDPVYRRHLAAHMFVNLGWFATTPFFPLFMKDHVGLAANRVVMLDAAVMLGSLASSFVWGWAADRYGGKPVMVSLIALHVFYPLGLLLMPRHSHWTPILAVALYFSLGFITIGWVIGFYRYFFINLIPETDQTAAIGLNTCMSGLMVGSGPLWAGFVIQRLSFLHGHLGPIHIDQFTPVLLFLIVCLIIATALFATLPARGGVAVRQFVGLFFQGNPLATAPGLVAFRFAGLEERRVAIVQKLGETRSPLTVNELIEALDDPSFAVRYEAIVSITRTRRDPSLTQALASLLKNADPSLQMAAVWALGRIADDSAKPALRAMLDFPYKLMRAQVARALGFLNDQASADQLLAMFHDESDPALRVAYASALAALARPDALPGMLKLLHDLGGYDNSLHRRREVALSIATLIGRDDAALQLWRRMHAQPGDTLGGVLLALRTRLSRDGITTLPPGKTRALLEHCAFAFARNDFSTATTDLQSLIAAINPAAYASDSHSVLLAAATALADFGPSRSEYMFPPPPPPPPPAPTPPPPPPPPPPGGGTPRAPPHRPRSPTHSNSGLVASATSSSAHPQRAAHPGYPRSKRRPPSRLNCHQTPASTTPPNKKRTHPKYHEDQYLRHLPQAVEALGTSSILEPKRLCDPVPPEQNQAAQYIISRPRTVHGRRRRPRGRAV